MPKRFHWGWIREGTFPIPPDADAFEWARALRVAANQKRLYPKIDFESNTVTIEKSLRNRKTRTIVPGTFEYSRDYPALAHVRTARNHGFKASFKKNADSFTVTIG